MKRAEQGRQSTARRVQMKDFTWDSAPETKGEKLTQCFRFSVMEILSSLTTKTLRLDQSLEVPRS